VHSDRGSYPHALALLHDARELSREAGDARREAYTLAMLGRLDLVRGEVDHADELLTAAVDLAQREHWLSFLPWPQALQGEVQLARHDPKRAGETLEQAFARACQLGDPCWEGMAERGLALVAEAAGDTERAFTTLLDARARAIRLADPYVWLEAHILDALCELGRRHAHPGTRAWVEKMSDLTSRTGMRELTVRAMLHSAALGSAGDASAAALLAADIENPLLQALVRDAVPA
jgi:hypothetical protein